MHVRPDRRRVEIAADDPAWPVLLAVAELRLQGEDTTVTAVALRRPAALLPLRVEDRRHAVHLHRAVRRLRRLPKIPRTLSSL